MINLFLEGGPWMMSVLTLLLVAIFFAAWKAPAWVKEIGKFALAFGVLSLLLGLSQIFGYLKGVNGEVEMRIIYAGFKVALIPVMYGIIIYLVSIIVRTIQEPKL